MERRLTRTGRVRRCQARGSARRMIYGVMGASTGPQPPPSLAVTRRRAGSLEFGVGVGLARLAARPQRAHCATPRDPHAQ